MDDERVMLDLSRALRGATDHLRYAGRVPRPRPPVVTAAVPVAAAATASVIGWTALSGPTAPGTAREAAPSRDASSATPTVEPDLVTEQIELAGRIFTYQRRADEPGPGEECPPGYTPPGDPDVRSCYLVIETVVDEVPADAESFDVDGVQMWVATDPEWDRSAVYTVIETGEIVAMLSQTRNLEQMREFVLSLSAG